MSVTATATATAADRLAGLCDELAELTGQRNAIDFGDDVDDATIDRIALALSLIHI